MGKHCKAEAAKDWPVLLRSFDISRRLLAGEVFTARRMLELYGVAPRQAFRLFREISIVFPVVQGERGENGESTYSLMPGFWERKETSRRQEPRKS